MSTFISHTIAAVLLVPIAAEVGKSFPKQQGGDFARLLIFLTGLVCSTGMGMPVSGFPNQTAYVLSFVVECCNLCFSSANQEDEMGRLYLTNVDFLKNGVPASIMAAFVRRTLRRMGLKLIHASGCCDGGILINAGDQVRDFVGKADPMLTSGDSV